MSGYICFIYGALLWHLRSRVRLVSWAWAPTLVLIVLTKGNPIEVWALMLLVPYAAISFATAEFPVIRSAGRFGDASYGLYIYAFLIQQTLMHAFPHISLAMFMVSSAVLSLLAGFASWHLLEKRALAIKNVLRQQARISPMMTVVKESD